MKADFVLFKSRSNKEKRTKNVINNEITNCEADRTGYISSRNLKFVPEYTRL